MLFLDHLINKVPLAYFKMKIHPFVYLPFQDWTYFLIFFFFLKATALFPLGELCFSVFASNNAKDAGTSRNYMITC